MSGKAPAFQFYVGDYMQDTRCLSLAARGAWADLLCIMWRSETRGEVTFSIENYARLFGCSIEETEAVINELLELKICDCVTERNAKVTERNKKITLICRRMKREALALLANKNRQKNFRERAKKSNNGESNAEITPPSSSSSSSSTSEEEITTNVVTKKTPVADAPSVSPKSADPGVREVFEFWQKTLNHPKAELDTTRAARIKARLKKFSVEDLKTVIQTVHADEWRMAEPSRHEIKAIFSDNPKVEGFLEKSFTPPPAALLSKDFVDPMTGEGFV